MKLSERAMLVSLHKSAYSGKKVDQEVGEETIVRKNAKKGATERIHNKLIQLQRSLNGGLLGCIKKKPKGG